MKRTKKAKADDDNLDIPLFLKREAGEKPKGKRKATVAVVVEPKAVKLPPAFDTMSPAARALIQDGISRAVFRPHWLNDASTVAYYERLANGKIEPETGKRKKEVAPKRVPIDMKNKRWDTMRNRWVDDFRPVAKASEQRDEAPVAKAKGKGPAKKGGKTVATGKGIMAEFSIQAGTNREKLLVKMNAEMGKQIKLAELAKSVYGKSDDASRGACLMVVRGLTATIEKKRLTYEVIKDGTDKSNFTFGLYATPKE